MAETTNHLHGDIGQTYQSKSTKITYQTKTTKPPTKFTQRNYQTKTYRLKPSKQNLLSELLIGLKLSGRQKSFSPGPVMQLAVLVSNGPAPLVIQPATEGNELLKQLFNDKQPTKGFRLLYCDLQISPRLPRS